MLVVLKILLFYAFPICYTPKKSIQKWKQYSSELYMNHENLVAKRYSWCFRNCWKVVKYCFLFVPQSVKRSHLYRLGLTNAQFLQSIRFPVINRIARMRFLESCKFHFFAVEFPFQTLKKVLIVFGGCFPVNSVSASPFFENSGEFISRTLQKLSLILFYTCASECLHRLRETFQVI